MLNTSLTEIQTLVLETYKTGNGVMARLDSHNAGAVDLSRSLERMAFQYENGVIALRNFCEKHYTQPAPGTGASPPPIRISGKVSVNEYGWVHIKLNTLLPHCRYTTPQYLTDTITRLLDEYESTNRKLPRFDSAMLVIDEHCDVDSRTVFDQDNKGGKAIPNALKGRLISDDDQFTLGVCLVSARSRDISCDIWLMPAESAGDFFYMRGENYRMFP